MPFSGSYEIGCLVMESKDSVFIYLHAGSIFFSAPFRKGSCS